MYGALHVFFHVVCDDGGKRRICSSFLKHLVKKLAHRIFSGFAIGFYFAAVYPKTCCEAENIIA
jgi:hypothetical protein